MTPDLIAKYDQRLPRYTSYPTAPHFEPTIDDRVYGGWLATLDPGEAISLYLHVPFCRALCWYCGCHTSVVNRPEIIADYAELLQDEIALTAAATGARPLVQTIHWGGGTPTMLDEAQMAAVMGAIRQNFRVGDNAEISVELDPRTMSRERAEALARLGVNRASLGVQDFDERVQGAINRIQPYETTADTIAWLRAAGIDAINLDLIYGLPHQTAEGVRRTVSRAADLGPDRMALFGYAHVPWIKHHQRLLDAEALPDTFERFEQAAAAAEALTGRGYRRIGLDHFARAEDSLSQMSGEHRIGRNFQGYTTDECATLLGFGVSSIGQLPFGHVQNVTEITAYRTRIRNGRLATWRGVRFSEEDRLRGAVIERLMCDLSVDLEAVAAEWDEAPEHFTPELGRLEPLIADGIATRDGWRIGVTEPGRPFLRAVAALFDCYLHEGEAPLRHSKAI
jgi:oxygen-independent coproporphyrinogen-3 oxidase